MADKKWSTFPDADNSGPITGVGLQGGENKKFPVAMQLLARGSISVPVTYLDFALPGTWRRYRLEMDGLQFDTRDSLSFLFSPDAGVTFYNGSEDYNLAFVNSSNSGPNGAGSILNPVGDFTTAVGSGTLSLDTGMSATMDIYPGSASLKAQTLSTGGGFNNNTTTSAMFWKFTRLEAAVGRQNIIRLFPDGNEDNPPTSGELITAGEYSLWGVP